MTRADVGSGPDEAALNNDPALSFVVPLLQCEHATAALRRRVGGRGDDRITVIAVKLLRHKVGRRCVLEFTLTEAGRERPARWIGKVRAKGTDHRAASIHRDLWDAGLRIIPEPLGIVAPYRMVLQRAAPGVSPIAQLHATANAPELSGIIVSALNQLHSTAANPGRVFTVDDELVILRERLTSLAERDPVHGAVVRRVQRRLLGLAEPLRHRPRASVIHRDFYHDQVLVDGARCTIVDLDLVAGGDAALDLGNFIAHLIELQWREQSPESTLNLARCVANVAQAQASSAGGSDAVARYAFLSFGRLVEIATHHSDRRGHFPALLSALDHALARCAQAPDCDFLLEMVQCNVA